MEVMMMTLNIIMIHRDDECQQTNASVHMVSYAGLVCRCYGSSKRIEWLEAFETKKQEARIFKIEIEKTDVATNKMVMTCISYRGGDFDCSGELEVLANLERGLRYWSLFGPIQHS